MNETGASLRLCLLVACAGLGAGTAMLMWQSSAVGSLLFMNHGLSHGTASAVERGVALVILAATLALAFRPARLVGAAVLLAGALAFTRASFDQGGYPFSRYVFAAHAMRLAAPLSLLLAILPFGAREAWRMRLLKGLLIAATVTTFSIHGYEALQKHPWFIDLTIGGVRNVLGLRLSQAQTEALLMVVAAVDFAAAAALVAFRSRAVAGWMVFWGLFTAALRVVSYGNGAWAEFIVRLPHGLLPLALAVLWRSRAPDKSLTNA
jgi:hypothetical protein